MAAVGELTAQAGEPMTHHHQIAPSTIASRCAEFETIKPPQLPAARSARRAHEFESNGLIKKLPFLSLAETPRMLPREFAGPSRGRPPGAERCENEKRWNGGIDHGWNDVRRATSGARRPHPSHRHGAAPRQKRPLGRDGSGSEPSSASGADRQARNEVPCRG